MTVRELVEKGSGCFNSVSISNQRGFNLLSFYSCSKDLESTEHWGLADSEVDCWSLEDRKLEIVIKCEFLKKIQANR